MMLAEKLLAHCASMFIIILLCMICFVGLWFWCVNDNCHSEEVLYICYCLDNDDHFLPMLATWNASYDYLFEKALGQQTEFLV